MTDKIDPTQWPFYGTFEQLIERLSKKEGSPEQYEATVASLTALFPVEFAQWVKGLTHFTDHGRLADDTETAARQFALRYQGSDYGWIEYGRFLTGLWCIAENNWTGARRAYEANPCPELPIEVQMRVFEYKDYFDRLVKTTSYIR